MRVWYVYNCSQLVGIGEKKARDQVTVIVL